MCLTYADRRALLEALDLDGPAWRTPDAFEDGEALLEATSAHGLEGIVAKGRSEPYWPGKRGWVKVKRRHYWRFGQELESARRRRRRSRSFEQSPGARALVGAAIAATAIAVRASRAPADWWNGACAGVARPIGR